MSSYPRLGVAAITVTCAVLASPGAGGDALAGHVGAADQAELNWIAWAARAVPAAGRT